MTDYEFKTRRIRVNEFPPFVRVVLKGSVRKELFLRVFEKVKTMKREYNTSEDMLDKLYGRKKGKILRLLSESPQTSKKLIEISGLSPSTVYHFLKVLRERQKISRKGGTYYLAEYNFDSLFLDEIVKLEEVPASRRKYGVSVRELELAYMLWHTFLEVAPEQRTYGQTYHSKYTLAEAVHRWKTGRTDIPVWALIRLIELSRSDILQKEGITQYHLPPGVPVIPYYDGEYKLPVRAGSDLDKIVIQLIQKLSKNCLYTFPKRNRWLFEKLHTTFGAFHDSTSRVPSAIIEILKCYYRIKTLDKYSARIPPRMKAGWSELHPLFQIAEKSSLLLHIISLSSQSSNGFEITSRSKSFLQDISALTFGLGLGTLSLSKKHKRPHFRVYLSKGKAAVLRRYTHLFQDYPVLELWSRIPLNQIAENIILTNADPESVELICCEELSRFVESILRSLERKKKEFSSVRLDYLQYKEEITDYFWKQKMIPSPRKVEELVGLRAVEEDLLYV